VSSGSDFKIDIGDVSFSSTGSTSGRRAKATRSSRRDSITGTQIVAKHEPTGVCVSGEIPRGRYSRKELQGHVRELRTRLVLELSEAVARELRLAGR
jgi:hypothetical protein